MIIGAATLIVIILLYVILLNSLVGARQSVSESWSDIDVQLKRRHDLIPNIVATVKGYTNHEQAIFEQIAIIRSQAINSSPDDISQRAKVETQLENTIHQLLAVSENYPELKANENFLELQKELTETEDEIASARRIYNDNVATYNTKISTIPNNFIANINHFTPANFFQNQ